MDLALGRACFEGGPNYLKTSLKIIRSRESNNAFATRMSFAYDPGIARSNLFRLKDILSQGLDKVTRTGLKDYALAMQNVNGEGKDITTFMQDDVLNELFATSGVYAFMDRVLDTDQFVISLIRRENIIGKKFDPITKKLIGLKFYAVVPSVSEDGYAIGGNSVTSGEIVREGDGYRLTLGDTSYYYDIDRIPVAYFELKVHLLEGVIPLDQAIINLASSDLIQALDNNVAIYVEQVHHAELAQRLMQEPQTDATKRERDLRKGIQYPIGVERPGFINQSDVPIRASMAKQDVIAQQIREKILRNLSDLSESRDADGGLSVLASYLQSFERQLVDIWKSFKKSKADIQVIYPTEFTLLTPAEISSRVASNTEQIDKTTSMTMKKSLLKENASLLLKGKVSDEVLSKIYTEIEQANIIALNPELVLKQFEAGIIGTEQATTVSGYPAEEARKAEEDRARRLAIIAASQAAGFNGAARGVTDLSPDSLSASNEKTLSQDDTFNVAGKAVRGENVS